MVCVFRNIGYFWRKYWLTIGILTLFRKCYVKYGVGGGGVVGVFRKFKIFEVFNHREAA